MEVLKIILTFAPPEPAKPLNDAQMCGSFYFCIMSNRIPFSKPYTNAHDLVQLLQSRGLSVNDTAKAEGYIDYTLISHIEKVLPSIYKLKILCKDTKLYARV